MRRPFLSPLAAAVTAAALLGSACTADETATGTAGGGDSAMTDDGAQADRGSGVTDFDAGTSGEALTSGPAPSVAGGAADAVDEEAGAGRDAGAPVDATFADPGINPWVSVAEDALSTFGMDVDTASYTVVRQWLNQGWEIEPAMVRLEEFVNRFTYDYVNPDADDVWSVTVDGADAPWTSTEGDTTLVRVGLQSHAIAAEDRPDATLTFVVDTSGSMDMDDRIGLVKESFRFLVEQLRPTDQVAIVEYGDTARLVLRPTPLAESEAVFDAIDSLVAGGSTFAEGGLRLGYDVARNAFDPDRLNAVVLASDGVANVGETGPDAMLEKARQEASEGITLLALGVGMGNYNDALLERLANHGDGSFFYLDTRAEAERLFGEKLVSTLMPVAEEAKVQVEFDPDVITDYRLLGYENRDIADEDFRDDTVDAGEVGTGHQVTAMYEVVIRDEPAADLALGATAMTVQLRWADPDSGEVTEIDHVVTLEDLVAAEPGADRDVAVAAAALAELLRQSPHVQWSYAGLDSWAGEHLPAAAEVTGQDDVAELLDLIRKAHDVSSE